MAEITDEEIMEIRKRYQTWGFKFRVVRFKLWLYVLRPFGVPLWFVWLK